MYNEQIIENLLPKISKLAEKHSNEYCDQDELFSEGQLYLVEYLYKRRSEANKQNIEANAYKAISHRLKQFADKNVKTRSDEESLSDIVTFNTIPVYRDIEFIELLRTILSERELIVIERYYGLNTYKSTFDQIGKDLQCSAETVRLTTRKAEHKIRTYLKKNNIDCLRDLFL